MKKRTGQPWIPATAYGALLPEFTVNLLVRDIETSVRFYKMVLLAHVHYADPDFVALRVLGFEFMLHADHTYERNPWAPELNANNRRGLGLELRLLGMDPNDVAERARPWNAVFAEPAMRGHGWNEVLIRDPDGYVWGVGVIRGAG